jgi:hypothetical protein
MMSWRAVAHEANAGGSPHLHTSERRVPRRGGNTTDDERHQSIAPAPASAFSSQ